jgi:hypothetical protein
LESHKGVVLSLLARDMSVGHLIVPENKKAKHEEKENTTLMEVCMPKGHRSQLKEHPVTKARKL